MLPGGCPACGLRLCPLCTRRFAFSPDSRTRYDRLAVGTSPPPFTPPPWLHLVGQVDNVLSVAFSPDGHTLASNSHDMTRAPVGIPDVDRVAECVCDIARPTVAADWDHYFPAWATSHPAPDWSAPACLVVI